MAYRSWSSGRRIEQLDRRPRLCPGHPRLSSFFTQSKAWMAGISPAMTGFGCDHPNTSNQILLGDDFAEPRIIRNELLDEFVHAVLEDIVHVAVFQSVAHPAGMALGGTLAAVGDTDLVEVAHQIAVAARQRPRQRIVEDQKIRD